MEKHTLCEAVGSLGSIDTDMAPSPTLPVGELLHCTDLLVPQAGTAGLWAWHFSSNLVHFDKYCAAMLNGQEAQEGCMAIGDWLGAIHPEDLHGVHDILSACLAGDRLDFFFECRVKGVSGQWVRIIDRGCILRQDPLGRPYQLAGLRINISSTQQSIIPASSRKEHPLANEELGRLAATVGHDFNNALMVILSQVQLMRLRLESFAEFSDEVELIEAATSRGMELASRLLQASKKSRLLQASKKNSGLANKKIELNSSVLGAVRLYRSLIPEHIQVKYLPMNVPLDILASKEDVEQIVCNLMINARDAIEATPPSSENNAIVVSTDTVVCGGTVADGHAISDSTSYAALIIKDTGIGIPKEEREKIFAPFYSTKVSGTGMGLAIIKDIVTNNEGEIFCETEPGKGSAFTVYLPLAPTLPTLSPEKKDG